MPTKAPHSVTFLTSPVRSGEMPQYATGTASRLLSVRVVVHFDKVNQWQVCEPTTGRNIIRHCATRASALRRAAERCALFGGVGALLHNMAHCADDTSTAATTTGGMRPSSNRMHSPELAYLAGGPLDAPERMAAGSTVAACYTKRPEVVSVARAGWFA